MEFPSEILTELCIKSGMGVGTGEMGIYQQLLIVTIVALKNRPSFKLVLGQACRNFKT